VAVSPPSGGGTAAAAEALIDPMTGSVLAIVLTAPGVGYSDNDVAVEVSLGKVSFIYKFILNTCM
jgi:hypothetical protein